ncbi:MAG: sigma 54-interacting transcriptional regulator [Planctomycetota bacterium]
MSDDDPSSQAADDGGGGATEEFRPSALVAPRQLPLPTLTWTDSRGPRSARVDKTSVVGSAESADIVIVEGSVSRVHAEVDPRQDGLWIRDLGSRNGTFVESVLVHTGRLAHGVTFRLGRTSVTVSYREATKQTVELWPEPRFGKLHGGSRVMREMFARLSRVATGDGSVIIQGETGTGKELVARAIHDASPRAGGPFIVVDCGALPENLLDAELFGHARGAFTGAANAREGAIEAAEGGTVFLDEIGELPLMMQPKLLRVLESRTIRRLGETAHRPVDVRFVCATHRDLLAMVGQREFREDLYFRLAVLPVRVPPLREHTEDIPALVELFAGAGADLPGEFARELSTRAWPGNVRELRNVVERAKTLGADEALAAPRAAASPAGATSGVEVDVSKVYRDFREDWIAEGEKLYFKKLLEAHDRNIREVARVADVNRSYVYKLIQRHGL